jgi:hypothetical protein
MTNPLSPAAQAVLDACDQAFNQCGTTAQEQILKHCLAAALEAVADQVFPLTKTPWGSTLVPVLTAQESRAQLLAIAAELEGH